MKSVLSIQDLSCVGRCSLTVALPVLSAMGSRCSVLPTAVLSTHTGFPNPEVIPLTEHIEAIGTHFQSVGVTFDAVTSGYMANATQAKAVSQLLREYRKQGSTIIVDPAMGDHGHLYSRLDSTHVLAMAELCSQGDILLPNVTEAALLSKLPYCQHTDETYLQSLSSTLLQRFPAKAVIITGVTGKEGTIGFFGCDRCGDVFSYYVPVVPRQFHGTGDLFSAVFTGGSLQGRTFYESGVLAADFVRRCVAGTPEVSPHGVEFETQLSHIFA